MNKPICVINKYKNIQNTQIINKFIQVIIKRWSFQTYIILFWKRWIPIFLTKNMFGKHICVWLVCLYDKLDMLKICSNLFGNMSRRVKMFRTECFLFFKNCLYTGIFGGKKYWYFRREILLIFSVVIITGIFGGNYYWYFRAEIL